MKQYRPLSEVGKLDLKKLATELRSADPDASAKAGLQLSREAESFGLGLRDYLILGLSHAVDKSKDGLNGYEAMLEALNLPVRNDLQNGVYLQAASDTFQTYPGTRALFPPVIDDILKFATRQDKFEITSAFVSGSRTMTGNELISTVVADDSAQRDTSIIAELGNIPIRTIRTSETAVKMWKHGSGIRTSYEFQRRASLDMLAPYAARVAREVELSKVYAGTTTLINGDGVNAAATVVTQSSYNTAAGVTATANQISWPNLLCWLVARAQAGTPVDTILMNWDAYLQWLLLFGKQTVGATTYNFGNRATENLAAAGVNMGRIDLLMNLTPALSSAVPAGRLIGITKAETLTELVEANASISETERLIKNQAVLYVKTETTGYKLEYGDTRSIYNFAA